MSDAASIERLLLEAWRPADGATDPSIGERAARTANHLASMRARVLLRGAPDYPRGLDDLSNAPAVVFAQGELPARSETIAIVGSRAATRYGMGHARALAADLASIGMAIVSGLARGIDAAAHEGALAAGGRTVAVLPGGLDEITPRHHRDLAQRIVARGAVLTEIPCGVPVTPPMFVRRNRLIAALASAVVVVEAAEKSGALSTAAAARRLGRPVLAFPGDVDRPTSRGCHALIRGGARLCERAGDVLDALRAAEPRPMRRRRVATGDVSGRAESVPVALSARAHRSATSAGERGARVSAPSGAASPPIPSITPEARLLAILDERAHAPEELARAAGLSLEAALATLLRLEWARLVVALPGQRWTRAGRACG